MTYRFYSIVIICALLIVGGTGCMNRNPNRQTEALNYLEEKYGETFTYVESTGSGYATPGVQKMFVQCDALEGQILVQVTEEDSGYSIADNYFAVKYRSDMEAKLLDMTNEIFQTAFVSCVVQPTASSVDLPADGTFAQYYPVAYGAYSISIAVEADTFDPAKADVWAQALQSDSIYGQLRFLVADEAALSPLTSELDFDQLLQQKSYQYFNVITIGAQKITMREWGGT